MSKSRSLGFLAALVAAALVFTAVAAGPTLAAKGGGRGGKGGGGSACATCALAVSPNPVPNGAGFTATGTGFSDGATVMLKVDFYGPWAYVTPSGGAFSYSFPAGSGLQPGMHAMYAYVNAWSVASVDFTVAQ